ncbi:MAG: 3'-5' exonuclease [Bacteroidales bacterium]
MNLTMALILAGVIIATILIFVFKNKRHSDEAEEEIKTTKQTLPPLPDFASRDPQTGEMKINFHLDDSESMEGMYLFVDVETTGLAKSTTVSRETAEYFPRIVQICWMLADSEFKVVNSDVAYIKQDAPIPKASIKIHRITDEMVAEKGEDPKAVFERMLVDINKAIYIVAHNIDFDIPVIESEFLRLDMKKPFRGKKKICTMKSGTLFCELPKSYGRGYKYPKLEELFGCCYFSGIGVSLSESHNAEVDVHLVIKCFIKLKELGYIETE